MVPHFDFSLSNQAFGYLTSLFFASKITTSTTEAIPESSWKYLCKTSLEDRNEIFFSMVKVELITERVYSIFFKESAE